MPFLLGQPQLPFLVAEQADPASKTKINKKKIFRFVFFINSSRVK
jgi:hypothetical protein